MYVRRNTFSSRRIQKNMLMKITHFEQREVQAFSLPPCSMGSLTEVILTKPIFNQFEITSGKTSRYFTALLVVKQAFSRNLYKTAYSLHNIFVFMLCIYTYLYSYRKAACGNTIFHFLSTVIPHTPKGFWMYYFFLSLFPPPPPRSLLCL